MKNIKKVAMYVLFVVICIGAVNFLVNRTKVNTMKENQTEFDIYAQNSGVSTSESPMSMESPSHAWSIPDTYIYELNDMFRFDADVIVSDSFTNGIFYKTRGIYQKWDSDAFYNMFFKDAEIKEEYIYNDMFDRYGKKAEGSSFFTTNGDVVCLYPDILIYDDGDEGDYSTAFTDLRANYDMYNAYKYSLINQLSFADRKEAVQTVLDTLNETGCHADGIIYKAYALDVDTLCSESMRVDESVVALFGGTVKKDWKKEEEAYAVYIWQEQQGLPVWTAKINKYSIADERSAPVNAIYGKDGYVRLEFRGFMDFEISNEYDVLLSFEDITDKICQKYNDVIASDTIVVREMMLCILTGSNGNGGYNLYPAWICTFEYEGGNSMGQMVFDAVTGYEIYEN